MRPRRWVAWIEDTDRDVVSSDLARTELLRAVRRAAPDRVVRAREVLDSVTLLDVTTPLYEAAARVDPPMLRTLDAVHLAVALDLGDDLETVVTYDDRLAAAAVANGVPVTAAALTDRSTDDLGQRSSACVSRPVMRRRLRSTERPCQVRSRSQVSQLVWRSTSSSTSCAASVSSDDSSGSNVAASWRRRCAANVVCWFWISGERCILTSAERRAGATVSKSAARWSTTPAIRSVRVPVMGRAVNSSRWRSRCRSAMATAKASLSWKWWVDGPGRPPHAHRDLLDGGDEVPPRRRGP